MSPPASGPSIGPTSDGIATKLMARTSSLFGNVRTSVSRPTGTIIAPPQPWMTRQSTSKWIWLTSPQSAEPSVNSAIAAAKTRRVPYLSATQPLIGMNTARLSA